MSTCCCLQLADDLSQFRDAAMIPEYSLDTSSDDSLFSFIVNGREFPVRIVRGSLRRRYLAVRVTDAGHVELLVPRWAAARDIRRVLSSKADWIQRHLQRVQQLPPVMPKRYVDGEQHLFRGRPYSLQLIPCSESRTASVSIVSDTERLQIRMKDPSPCRVRKVLERWYREEAYQLIGERLAALCLSIPWLKRIPSWKLRTMHRRWGSCSHTGELTLNTQLIKVPEYCLDFVLLHEVAHLREMNHGQRFYALLETLLPDWKDRKRELDRMGRFVLEKCKRER